MKKLIIMSGPPACGKTTLIEELGLQNNTLSPDKIRMMFSGCNLGDNFGLEVSQRDSYMVFQEINNMLRNRMNYGLLTVIDACHTSERDIDRYKALAMQYSYEVVLVNFKVSLKELFERNNHREFPAKEEDIKRMYEEKKNAKIPRYIKKISPEQLANEIRFKFKELRKYKNIYHIGDIHGCATVLKEAIGGSINYDDFYIFTGDYINKGLENVETLKYLISIMRKPNVVFLKGNHEVNLVRYLNGEEIRGKSFERARKEIDSSNLSQKDLKEFCRRLQGYYAYSFKGKKYFCCHGGVSHLEHVNLISEYNFILGSSEFNADIDSIWSKNVEGVSLIHGHRNDAKKPIKAAFNSYNLEGDVESGGHLRKLTITSSGMIVQEYKNDIFDENYQHEVSESDLS